MINFIKLSRQDQLAANRIAADKLNVHEAITEKDFWVVFILELLFSKSKYASSFVFKGGTSLSKAYGIIQCFSEDIDLILDWRVLGYKMKEPWENRSKTAQRKFNEEANERASTWIAEFLLPDLQQCLVDLDVLDVDLKIATFDSQTIQIYYPKNHKEESLLQEVRLEIGPLAAWTPVKKQIITSYISQELPQLFNESSVIVPTVEASRTFWEKATILHKEANRVNGHSPARYSRHYYDLYQMCSGRIKEEALADMLLLKTVVTFKSKFYADNAAKYEEIATSGLKLIPSQTISRLMEEDYKKMQGMIFADSPTWEQIVMELIQLEKEIAKLLEIKC